MAHNSKRLVIVLSLFAAGFFAAWLRMRSYLAHEGRFTDGTALYQPASDAGVRFAVWDAPTKLPEPLNSPASETRPTVARDGRSIVFAVGKRGLNMDLYVADLVDGAPADPRPIESLNSGADDCAPAFRGDDLYFASDRAGGAGGLDVYRARWNGAGFGPPERLAGAINSPADDCDPAPRPATVDLVFASRRGGGNFDLYVAHGEAGDVEPIPALDSARDEREPTFSPDGRALFFASDRRDGGSFDLWRSFDGADGWLEPAALDALNSAASERGPSAAADGFTLYFTREDAEHEADVLCARTLELYRLPGRPVGWLDLVILASLLSLALMAYLAQRWPALDTIYKCFLVSVLVHLALLWWFRDVWMEGSSSTRHDGDERHRVRLLSPDTSRMAEHGGRLSTPRTTEHATESELERPAIAQRSDADAAPPADEISEALAAPIAREDSRPARARTEVAPGASDARVAVALQDADSGASAATLRTGTARELSLAPSATDTPTPERSSDSPTRTRIASSATTDEPAPTAHLDVSAENAPTAHAPARSADLAADRARTHAVAPAVDLAAPNDIGGRRTTATPELALQAHSGGTRSARDESAPARVGRADLGSSDRAEPARPPGADVRAIAVGPAAPESSAGRRAPASLDPLGSARDPVALQDGEARSSRIGGERDAPAHPTADDLMATLAPASTSRADRTLPSDELPVTPHLARQTPAAERAPDIDLPLPTPTRSDEAPQVPRANWEHTPYQNRAGEEKARAIELFGGSPETEEAVGRGLSYLASIQRSGGQWGDLDARDDKYGQVAVGKSGLCLLAFLGAGHTHASGTRYSEVVQRALDALLAVQDEASGHFGDTAAYSHGIATYALAECLALSHDERLRAPLQAAVAHILAKQSKKRDPRFFGGWGYFYDDERTFDRWPRTSITAWQVMALESARLSGIEVPDAAFDGARAFLENARDEDGEYYRYNHDPERLNSGYPTLPASTPAALFALSLLGEDIQSAAHAPERAFVLTRAPKSYRYTTDDAFVARAQGNLYFWYYGTLAMFRTGGGAWTSWNEAMKKTLLPAQDDDGSWRPIDIYARYARDTEADRSYTTAMCVLSLEIYYRYFLPLLKVR